MGKRAAKYILPCLLIFCLTNNLYSSSGKDGSKSTDIIEEFKSSKDEMQKEIDKLKSELHNKNAGEKSTVTYDSVKASEYKIDLDGKKRLDIKRILIWQKNPLDLIANFTTLKYYVFNGYYGIRDMYEFEMACRYNTDAKVNIEDYIKNIKYQIQSNIKKGNEFITYTICGKKAVGEGKINVFVKEYYKRASVQIQYQLIRKGNKSWYISNSKYV